MKFIKLSSLVLIIISLVSCVTFRTDLSDYDKLCMINLGHPNGNHIEIPNGGLLPFFEIYKEINNEYVLMIKLDAAKLPMRNYGNRVEWIDTQSNIIEEKYKVYATNELGDQKIPMNHWITIWDEAQKKFLFKEEIRFDE